MKITNLELNNDKIQSIRLEGFCMQDDVDVLHPHTEETRTLFLEGLEACGELNDEDFYAGISIANGQAFAEIDRPDKTEYLAMSFVPYQQVIANLESIKVNHLDIGIDREIIEKINDLIQFIEETKGKVE